SDVATTLTFPSSEGTLLDLSVGRASQREVEGRSLSHFALRPDAAAVAMYDALHGREADPRPLEVLGGVQALKGREELAGVRGVEPHAVVPHEERGLAVSIARPHDHVRFGATRG